jgi:hypothetical protein
MGSSSAGKTHFSPKSGGRATVESKPDAGRPAFVEAAILNVDHANEPARLGDLKDDRLEIIIGHVELAVA